MRTLREVKVGETVTIHKIEGEGAVRRRIMDMGLVKGIPLTVRKVAPLGDPIEITITAIMSSPCARRMRKASSSTTSGPDEQVHFFSPIG